MVVYKIGRPFAIGQRNVAYSLSDHPELISLRANEDEAIKGKAAFNAETSANVFTKLNTFGIPTDFWRKLSRNQLFKLRCHVWPYKIVVRTEAHGSFLKRYPEWKIGQQFAEPIVEWFLEAPNRHFGGRKLPVDNPLLVMHKEHSYLYMPDKPMAEQVACHEIWEYPPRFAQIENMALQAFALLQECWSLLGCKLIDIKFTFGFDNNNIVRLVGYIDNDHWRLEGPNGEQLGRNPEAYSQVAEMSKRFIYR